MSPEGKGQAAETVWALYRSLFTNWDLYPFFAFPAIISPNRSLTSNSVKQTGQAWLCFYQLGIRGLGEVQSWAGP